MQTLRHIGFITLKDLKRFVTDRIALFFSLLFPILFIILFSLMMRGVGVEDNRMELHLVTREAESGLSHQIIAAMETKDEAQLKPGEPKIVWDKDYDETRRAVESRKLAGFLAFSPDFTEGVLMGYGTQLEVVVDAEATYTAAALKGMAQSISSQVGARYVADSAVMGMLVEQGLSTPGGMASIGAAIQQMLSGQGGAAAPPRNFIEVKTDRVGDVEAETPSNWVVPGYLVMFVFMTGAASAELIVRERQNRTLERLLATSVRRESILAGMFAGTATKGLVQIVIFWIAGVLFFRVDMGSSPVAVVLLSFLMVIMSAAFAVMLATMVRTERSANSIAVLMSLVLAPLGGCWWPLFITPKWMQAIAQLTPHGWATTGFNKLMVFGADFSAAIPNMLVLAGFAVLFGIIAIWRFRTSAV